MITRKTYWDSHMTKTARRAALRSISVVIPTYRREQVLVDTIEAVLALDSLPGEAIVVDQSPVHEPAVESRLKSLENSGAIRWLRQTEPSITKAMNIGLAASVGRIVLYLDDDVVPMPGLIPRHLAAHAECNVAIVAGRVLQPWHKGVIDFADEPFHFASTKPRKVEEFSGGNFSLKRDVGLSLGGFDENFVKVAYNFEAEFAYRVRKRGYQIIFEPDALIDHLKVPAGGTRSFGEHLKTVRPDHAVGAYYYILCSWSRSGVRRLFFRFFRAAATRHHLKQPWWIPLTLFAELRGLLWAFKLALSGPKYLQIAARRGASVGK